MVHGVVRGCMGGGGGVGINKNLNHISSDGNRLIILTL